MKYADNLQEEEILSSEAPVQTQSLNYRESRRHMAFTFLQLDDLLSKDHTLEDFDSYLILQQEIFKILKPIQDLGYIKSLNPFLEVLNQLEERKKNSRKVRQKALELSTQEQKTMGVIFFQERTHKQPQGNIKVEQKEGYFILEFEKSADYADFRRNNKGSAGSLLSQIRLFGNYIDLILINGEDQRYPTHTTINHERHHFIYSLLLPSFHSLEPFDSSSKTLRFQEGIKEVKDEFLARIIDESLVEDKINFFRDPAYHYLRDYFSVQEIHHIDDTLQSMKAPLSTLIALFDDVGSHKLLLYSLIDVSFFKIPTYLKLLERFYKNQLAQFQKPLLHSSINHIPPFYRGEIQNIIKEMKKYIAEAYKYLLGAKNVSYEEAQTKIQAIKSRIELLESQYYTLFQNMG